MQKKWNKRFSLLALSSSKGQKKYYTRVTRVYCFCVIVVGLYNASCFQCINITKGLFVVQICEYCSIWVSTKAAGQIELNTLY
jgi:hypothetical protein